MDQIHLFGFVLSQALEPLAFTLDCAQKAASPIVSAVVGYLYSCKYTTYCLQAASLSAGSEIPSLRNYSPHYVTCISPLIFHYLQS